MPLCVASFTVNYTPPLPSPSHTISLNPPTGRRKRNLAIPLRSIPAPAPLAIPPGAEQTNPQARDHGAAGPKRFCPCPDCQTAFAPAVTRLLASGSVRWMAKACSRGDGRRQRAISQKSRLRPGLPLMGQYRAL